MESKFEHKVSRGSRFNQIYVPKGMERIFEAGDIVEVRLVKKKELYYSTNLDSRKIGEFKEGIIRRILSHLGEFKEIRQAFVVGSFLTQKTEYNDIDVLLITNNKFVENRAYVYLSGKIQLKFHVIAIPEERFVEILKICPMTRSMMQYFASDKEFKLPVKSEMDSNHIEFLLMMPEDLLKLNISGGRVYFDAVRRLITIGRFMEGKLLDSIVIDSELKIILGKAFYDLSKRNESFSEKALENVREIIRREIERIRKRL